MASADIHAPRFEKIFVKSVEEITVSPDLIVLAGDLVDKNNALALKNIYNLLTEKFKDKPVVAIYGNEEYRGFEDKYRELYSKFAWLNDEYLVLNVKEYKIGVIGTRGALDKPTSWQSRNLPGIREYYEALPAKISQLVDEVRSTGVDVVIFISHYGVTFRNLEGEPRSIWPYLACSKLEEVIFSKNIDLVIHGHAHNGLREVTYIGSTPVYNVSLPARGRVVLIEYQPSTAKPKGRGLDRWLKR